MKIGLGLYRHMLTQEYYDFARQAGCTDVVVHLTDYFREANECTRQSADGRQIRSLGYRRRSRLAVDSD
jgi:hypothetical protein